MIYLVYLRVFILFRRIHTYLPERKKLWDNQEESIASKMGREKLTKLEEEQKVLYCQYYWCYCNLVM